MNSSWIMNDSVITSLPETPAAKLDLDADGYDSLIVFLRHSQTTLLGLVVVLYTLTGGAYLLTWSTHSLAGRAFASMLLSRACHLVIYWLLVLGYKWNWAERAPSVCIFIGYAHQLVWMSEYSWLLVVNWDFWRTFRNLWSPRRRSNSTVEKGRKFRKYCAVAWSLPLLIVTSSLVVYFVVSGRNQLGKYEVAGIYIPDFSSCTVSRSALILYVIPVISFFVIAALALAVATQRHIHRSRSDTALARLASNTDKEEITSFRLFQKLSVLMGINWKIEFILGLIIVLSISTEDTTSSQSEEDKVASLVYLSGGLLFIIYMLATSVFIGITFVWRNHAVTGQLRRKWEAIWIRACRGKP